MISDKEEKNRAQLLGIGDLIASTQMTALSGTAGILYRAMNL